MGLISLLMIVVLLLSVLSPNTVDRCIKQRWYTYIDIIVMLVGFIGTIPMLLIILSSNLNLSSGFITRVLKRKIKF